MNPNALEDFIRGTIANNSLETYGSALGLFVAVVLGAWVFKRVGVERLRRLAARTRTDVDDFLVEMVGRVGWRTYLILAAYAGTRPLALSRGVDHAVTVVVVLALAVTAARVLEHTIVFVFERAYGRTRAEDPTRASVIRNIAVVVRIGLWVAVGLFVLDNIGVQITGIVAGLGIGGIAVALAAQTVLGDTFNSFAIYLDRPFEVGDFIIVGDMLGVVEHVGFKTTRIRSLYGEQLIFSNTDLASSRIRNYKRMYERRITFTFGVIYQTPLSKVRRISGMVEEIVRAIDLTRFDRAHFKAFGTFALEFEVVYYVLSPDYNKYMDIQQEINLRIMEAFEREGIRFAYPVQTVFVADDRSVGVLPVSA